MYTCALTRADFPGPSNSLAAAQLKQYASHVETDHTTASATGRLSEKADHVCVASYQHTETAWLHRHARTMREPPVASTACVAHTTVAVRWVTAPPVLHDMQTTISSAVDQCGQAKNTGPCLEKDETDEADLGARKHPDSACGDTDNCIACKRYACALRLPTGSADL